MRGFSKKTLHQCGDETFELALDLSISTVFDKK